MSPDPQFDSKRLMEMLRRSIRMAELATQKRVILEALHGEHDAAQMELFQSNREYLEMRLDLIEEEALELARMPVDNGKENERA